jgi:hypothetical protein
LQIPAPDFDDDFWTLHNFVADLVIEVHGDHSIEAFSDAVFLLDRAHDVKDQLANILNTSPSYIPSDVDWPTS